MADRMEPPGSSSKGKPGIVVAIGVPKHGDNNGRMPPPGGDSWKGSGKVSPEEAGVVREDAHCIDCAMYHPDTGECDKVDSTFSPQDACSRYFTPLEEEGGETPSEEASENEMAER